MVENHNVLKFVHIQNVYTHHIKIAMHVCVIERHD